MELQQNLNLVTRILKQTVGFQYICKEDFILNIKGKQWNPFFRFLVIRQYCDEPALYEAHTDFFFYIFLS